MPSEEHNFKTHPEAPGSMINTLKNETLVYGLRQANPLIPGPGPRTAITSDV